MDRTILHCDCNGFYASVECILRPELRLVPMAVGGDPESRHGIILAKNELAKKYRVQTAETIWQAKRKCPSLVVVPPHRQEYSKYAQLINEIYLRFTDLVEPFSIDESFLDVTGSLHLFGAGPEIADQLRRTVREELGLTISVGVSYNKIFAKMGSDYKKPDATTVITRENYRQILWPLPVEQLFFVGKNAKQTLNKLGIQTIGDLAQSNRGMVAGRLGKVGELIHDYACGIDDSPVKSFEEKREVKSVGNGTTFRTNLVGWEEIAVGVVALSDCVAVRLRRHHKKCGTIQVTIKDPEFQTISRQRGLTHPTYLAREIYETAMELIKKSWRADKPIRMITITGTNLTSEGESSEQLSLFEVGDRERRERQEKLEVAMDNIRNRFGKNAVTFGRGLENNDGIGWDTKNKEKK